METLNFLTNTFLSLLKKGLISKFYEHFEGRILGGYIDASFHKFKRDCVDFAMHTGRHIQLSELKTL